MALVSSKLLPKITLFQIRIGRISQVMESLENNLTFISKKEMLLFLTLQLKVS